MDVTTGLEKPEDGDFSGDAPGFFCLYGIRRIALVDFDLFFRSIMSGNDFPTLAVEQGRCIAIDADDLRSTARGRACNEILQKTFLGGKYQPDAATCCHTTYQAFIGLLMPTIFIESYNIIS